MEWSRGSDTKAYKYTYDTQKQLSSAKYLQKNGSTWSDLTKYAEKDITYNLNGNITSLKRTNSAGSDLHNITYNYKLTTNSNAVSSVAINGQTFNYAYDVAGNLTNDGYRGVKIEYNILNLPQKIFAGSENITYIYTSAGIKLATKVGSSLTYYRGPFVYKDLALI